MVKEKDVVDYYIVFNEIINIFMQNNLLKLSII